MVRAVFTPTFLFVAPAGEHPAAPEPAPQHIQMPDQTAGHLDERDISPADFQRSSSERLYDDRGVTVGPQTGDRRRINT